MNANAPKNNISLRPLPGSDRGPAPRAVPQAEKLDPHSSAEVTLILRRRAELPDDVLSRPVPAAELARRFGADPGDVELVTSTLGNLGAEIIDSDPGSRRVRIRASVAELETMFGTTLERVTSVDSAGSSVSHRHRTGALSVPAALDGVITAVLGLDDRPQLRTKLRMVAAEKVATSYTPLELGQIYQFPAGTDGSGHNIGILELGGGYVQADLDTYFTGLGITGPTVTAVGVDGAINQPGKDPDGADGEVMLDIEVAGALAPKAGIIVYFAPNTDAGFVDALSQAAHADAAPAAISISWGQSEDQWTAQARTAFDEALQDAAALGITVTAAAGDDGSADRETDGKVHTDFPASSPHVLACGGTTLTADAATGTISTETVWNNGKGKGATGGGVSDSFALPSWQKRVGVPKLGSKTGRGVPDVSAVADPYTGYQIRVDGKDLVMGGTSAVAPLWAALAARLVQSLGRPLGLAQPALYGDVAAGAVAPGFRDITEGHNGVYKAGRGWDACTGLGVPDGTALLEALTKTGGGGAPSTQPPAGDDITLDLTLKITASASGQISGTVSGTVAGAIKGALAAAGE